MLTASSKTHMLEASRNELKKEVPSTAHGLERWLRLALIWMDDWIYEPIATGFRFLHLLGIFVPVVITIPVVWFGRRVEYRDNERSGTLWWYGFLVHAMERAGPAFIKLGQWVASRKDIFPSQMCSVMASLHSNAPAHSLKDTKRIVQRAFGGRSFDEIFEEFQETPLGVGAIAQVYKAKLKPDLAALADTDISSPEGPNIRERMRKNVDALVKSTPSRVPSSYVAIKILHPKVERIVRRDLRIMGFFAKALNAIPTFEWFSFPDEVAQFAMMMRLQLDLRIEAANLTIFRNNFKDRSTAWFPYPYVDFTTRQVLVEEFAHGIPLADFLEDGGGVFQQEIANEGLDAFLRMLLLDNFVHADLHPGNIMVRFYKPVQPEFHLSRKSNKSSSNPAETGQDVTEEVLSRLRPLRRQPEKWVDQLAKIEADGYRPQLIFIDTGLVTALNATNRRNFLELFRAVAEFDGYRAGQLMIERCRQPEAVIDGDVYALRMQNLVLGVRKKTFALGSVDFGQILSEVLQMVRAHHVRMEGDFVNVVLSIFLLEGIGRHLYPDLDLFRSALPLLRELGSQQGGASLVQTVRDGDFSILKVWIGLEARKFFQASVEDVSHFLSRDCSR